MRERHLMREKICPNGNFFMERFEHYGLRKDAKGVNKSKDKISAIKSSLANITPGIPDITFP